MALHADTTASILVPCELDLAYAAGLIDGEGCVYAAKNGAGIKVSMTQPSAVGWLAARFGGTLHPPRQHKQAAKPVHTWTIQRQADLLLILPPLLPYMLVKRAKAERLIELLHHKAAKPYHWTAPTWAEWAIERDRLVAAVRSQEDS